MAVVNDAEVKQPPLHIDDLGADKPPSSSSDNAWKSYFWNTLDKSPEERRFLFKLDAALLTFTSLGYFIKHLDQIDINNAFALGMKEDLGLYIGYVLDDLYVLHLFIGLAESIFYPGMQYIIGSWYRKDELASRSSISHASGALRTMFSGYSMATVYNLNSRGGSKGWQWLFIINTAISLPIAIGGFFFLPGLLKITRPCWHIYLFVALYVVLNNGGGALSQPAFPLWPKSKGYYSITQINTYPTIAAAITVLSALIYAAPIVFSTLANIVVYSSLSAWSIPDGWKWVCFLLAGFGGGIAGMALAWANEACSDGNEERALVAGSMNELVYVVQAWLPLLIWQQPEAPRYFKG
ncbi:major facilitator superfamily domain-containing protein [Lasiosphaeria miniovina]|uniref:Major facilitator superfamily domain-containing protein n=1 Tax=Lasiosphaeria miniovina TaxID=1954250 RepID=A0AA40A4T5_9PEZI|nr:major facilitator superfamily domain-containing protein [Lasiosphaeria miniovina]KAK0709171.1 major facilitator superfamily domain-containing protein [Lasiosphaeria miniovina]